MLLTWDRPFTRAVQDLRSPLLDDVMSKLTRLGHPSWPIDISDGGFILATTGILLGLYFTWKRCRAVALLLLLATLVRPLLEWTLKSLSDRPRPDLVLGVFDGPSFPSGHVMASVAFWGLLPPVVALFTRRRWLWWASVAVSGTIITVVAATRVYLGAHWLSDVVGGLMLGSIYLLAMEGLLGWTHKRAPCPCHPQGDGGATAADSDGTASSDPPAP